MKDLIQYWLLRAIIFSAHRLFPHVYLYCPNNNGDIVTGLVFATNKFHLAQFANLDVLEDALQREEE